MADQTAPPDKLLPPLYRKPKKKYKQEKMLNRLVKVSTAKAMHDNGFTYQQISKLLKIGKTTIYKYIKLDNPQVKALSESMSKQFLAQDFILNSRTYDKIRELIESDEFIKRAKLPDLTALYKVSRELITQTSDGSKGSQTNIQIITSPDSYSIRSESPTI